MWCAHKDCWWASAKKEQQFWVRENGLARMIISTRSLRNCKYVNALGNRQMNRLLIVHLLVFTLCLLLYINMHENWSWNVSKYFTHSIEVPKLTHVLVQYMYGTYCIQKVPLHGVPIFVIRIIIQLCHQSINRLQLSTAVSRYESYFLLFFYGLMHPL